jgi:hypothetical protein
MTDIHVIRYTTRPDAIDENARLVAGVYGELAARRPAGLRYATLLLPAEGLFLHVVTHDGARHDGARHDGEPDGAGAGVLPGLPAFQEFQRELAGRVLAPPVRSPAVLVGRYRIGGYRVGIPGPTG